jgi:hypothetical protein
MGKNKTPPHRTALERNRIEERVEGEEQQEELEGRGR